MLLEKLSDKVIEFRQNTIFQLRRARTEKAYDNVLREAMAEIGFSKFSFVKLVDGNVKLFSTNLEQPIVDNYLMEKFDEFDASLSYVQSPPYQFFHSELAEFFAACPVKTQEAENTLNYYKMLKNFGYPDAYVRMAQPTSLNIVVVIFQDIFKDRPFNTKIQKKYTYITVLLDCIARTIDAIYPIKAFYNGSRKQMLTKKQKEVLYCLGHLSMTQEQAADECNLTVSTVKTYCKIIKEKLGRRTLSGCVYEGLHSGILPMDCDDIRRNNESTH